MGLLTVYFVRAVNDCVCCMSVSDEVHAIFLTVQGSLWSDKEMDREKKTSKSSIRKIWDFHKEKNIWLMWQGWGFLVSSNSREKKKTEFLPKGKKTNGINQEQRPLTSEHQMPWLGSRINLRAQFSLYYNVQKSALRKSASIWEERHTKQHKSSWWQRGIWKYIKPVRPELTDYHS